MRHRVVPASATPAPRIFDRKRLVNGSSARRGSVSGGGRRGGAERGIAGQRCACDRGGDGRERDDELVFLAARPRAVVERAATGRVKRVDASRRIAHAVMERKPGIAGRGVLHGAGERMLRFIVVRAFGGMHRAGECWRRGRGGAGRGGGCAGRRGDGDRADHRARCRWQRFRCGESGEWKRTIVSIAGGAIGARGESQTRQSNEQQRRAAPARDDPQAHGGPPHIIWPGYQ